MHLRKSSHVHNTLIPLSVPELRGNEWKYVKQCLNENWVSSAGKYVELFEQKLAEYVGTRYAVATCNGTAALHTALMILGIGKGDEVIIPTAGSCGVAKQRMENKKEMKCYDWFFCTKKLSKDEVLKAVLKK